MSQHVHFNFGRHLNRRTLLRGTGVSLALPWLTAMDRAFATEKQMQRPKRFVAMTLGLGLLGENLNPKQSGRDYEPSLYLKHVADIKDHFTVISGTSHPEVTGGHRAEASILTANPVGSAGRAKNTISVDQLMAKFLGGGTRFPSIVVSSSGSNSPSYTDNGAMIPALDSPARMFQQLFVEESEAERKLQARRAREGRSIMDLVANDANKLSRKLGKGDKQRLDEYLTSVRDLEVRLAESEAWSRRPKPKVDAPKPVDIRNPNDFIGKQRLMNDMIKLALQTDSTRFITYHLGGSGGVPPIEGIEEGYHTLSHHGRDEDKMTQLAILETEIIKAWGDFHRDLLKIKEGDRTLLELTPTFLTSNLGNASNHSNSNMPVLVAGGNFKHGQHLAFDQRRNYPLPNLFVNLLQDVGLPRDQFASSTGTMKGLETT